ncbi:MAG: hypothetical protein HKN28_16565, partial [Alphaproteobacteria bacterium]|nr:hypothetical protein [Alphaproteobacteria bacterium]
ARRYSAPSADAELTAGEDRFARALALRTGEGAPPDNIVADDLAPEDLAEVYAVAWPGRAKRFRPETIAAKADRLLDSPLIQAAISHYRAERAGAPERLDWGRAQKAQADHQRKVRLGLGVREIDSPVDRCTDQTRSKLRADVIGKLHDGGHLRDEHVTAAEEISQLVLAFLRGMFPSSRPLDGTRGGGNKVGTRQFLDPADRMNLWEARKWSECYAPWSREMGAQWVSCRRGRLNRLGLVWAVVLDNMGPRQLEQTHGMRHGTARRILAEALRRDQRHLARATMGGGGNRR